VPGDSHERLVAQQIVNFAPAGEAGLFDQATGGRRTAPVNALTRKSTKNTTNKTCAIQAAFAAMPEKPNTAAISATIKNVKAQFNMVWLLSPFLSPRCDLVRFVACRG
jgi:hypothetical protein